MQKKLLKLCTIVIGAIIALSACTDDIEDNKASVMVTFAYTLNTQNGSSMTRTVTNEDVFSEFYDKIISGELIASSYSLTFTEISSGRVETFAGEWDDSEFFTLRTGLYRVKGETKGKGDNIQEECSFTFDELVDINAESKTITLHANYNCYLLIFNNSKIVSLENNNGNSHSPFYEFGEYRYAFVNDKLFLESQKEKACIIGKYADGTDFKMSTSNLNFEKGKYYVYNSAKNSFDIPRMEDGNASYGDSQTDESRVPVKLNRTLTSSLISYANASAELYYVPINGGDIVSVIPNALSTAVAAVLKELPDWTSSRVDLAPFLATGETALRASNNIVTFTAPADAAYIVYAGKRSNSDEGAKNVYVNGVRIHGTTEGEHSYTFSLQAGVTYRNQIDFPFKKGDIIKMSIVDADNIIAPASNEQIIVKSIGFGDVGTIGDIRTKSLTTPRTIMATEDAQGLQFVSLAEGNTKDGTIIFNVSIVGNMDNDVFEGVTRSIITVIDDDTSTPVFVQNFRDACNACGIPGTYACLTRYFENYPEMPGMLRDFEKEGHQIVVHGYAQKDYFRDQKKIEFFVSDVTVAPRPGSYYNYVGADGQSMTLHIDNIAELTDGSGTVIGVYYTQNEKNPPVAYGTIKKISGTGDDVITYTSYEVSRFRDLELAEENLRRGIQDLNDYGFSNYEYWVAQYGSHDEELQSLVKKCGLNALVAISMPYNIGFEGEYGRWCMPRYGLNINDGGSSLTKIKAAIDEAAASETPQWIIVGTHFNTGWTENDVNNTFKVMVNYAKSKGLEFVTLHEGMIEWLPVFDLFESFSK